jgi:ribose 5-phosphate isomerase A
VFAGEQLSESDHSSQCCRRRPSSGTANPRGGKDPYISPDGHNICDIRFYEGLKLFGEDAPVSIGPPAPSTEGGLCG